MYKVYKRKSNTYHYTVRYKEHVIRKSARTTCKPVAEQIARKAEADLIGIVELGDKPQRTWADAVIKWRGENEHKKSLKTDIYRLRVLNHYLPQTAILGNINKQQLNEIITDLKEERELSNSSINRYQSLISVILRAACNDWEWIESYPRLKKRAEPKRRVRWISSVDAKRLIERAPQWHRNPLSFGFATGLRKSNLYGLKWAQVDLAGGKCWFHPDETKQGRYLTTPLGSTAKAILKEQFGQHGEYVFGGINPPRHDVFRRWCRKAGIDDFRIHDIRHTWASWHVQKGTSLQQLMELGGWSSLEMVLKYAHLSQSSLTEAADKIKSSTHTTHKGEKQDDNFLEVV